MMQIIQTYGFPSDRLFRSMGEDVHPFIILIHAPYAYFEKLRAMLKVEKAAGRIAEVEYAGIMWHLNSRKQYSPNGD
jgi:hypothetical protein